MNSGIPKEVSKYTHRFDYNDINSLKYLFNKFRNKVACVIMEPMSKLKPYPGFLNDVKKITHKNNALLVFDEVVTGFRVDSGGYQKIAKVKPDMSCFSKAMGNGFPISALVGKREVMSKSQDIFYSLTFGGETLSLSASIATLKMIDKYDICKRINLNGQRIIDALNKKIKELNLQDFIFLSGYPGKLIFNFKGKDNIKAETLRIFWIYKLIQNGILNNGIQILSYSHNEKIVNKLIKIYSEVLEEIKFKQHSDFFLNKFDNIILNKDLRK